jgi:hypothetical protein
MSLQRETLRLLPPARFKATSVLCHDPGDKAGGLAVVEVLPGTVTPSVRWVLSYEGKQARLWQPGQELVTVSSGCLFGLLAIAPSYQGDFVGELLRPFKGFNAGFRTLVEAAGAVKHWARARGCVVSTAEPAPNDWRGQVLGLKVGTAADACATTAVAAVEDRQALGSRYHVELGLVQPVRPIDEHGAEAVCVGLWALGFRLSTPG